MRKFKKMFNDDLKQQSVIKQCVKSPLIANCKSQVPALFFMSFHNDDDEIQKINL